MNEENLSVEQMQAQGFGRDLSEIQQESEEIYKERVKSIRNGVNTFREKIAVEGLIKTY